jgi:hypothetical protein
MSEKFTWEKTSNSEDKRESENRQQLIKNREMFIEHTIILCNFAPSFADVS